MARIYNGQNSLFNKWFLENWTATCKTMRMEYFLTTNKNNKNHTACLLKSHCMLGIKHILYLQYFIDVSFYISKKQCNTRVIFILIFSVEVELKKQTKELDDVESYVK